MALRPIARRFRNLGRAMFLAATFSAQALAQEAAPSPPVLENTGKPIALPFSCTAEDIQTAGLTCSDREPCLVYLELTGVEAAGNRIVVTGDLHTAAETIYSELLGSSDEGRTWRELHPRIRTASLDRVQFADAQTGWISGEHFAPLAQDPFLLLTTDGGDTWRERPVFGDDAEDRQGAIQQFGFSDRSHGSLIIDRGQGSADDRYELYESQTGGESWNIRQSSPKPLQIRAAAPETGAWRVRADRVTQAFQVEHRQGGAWRAVASFLVAAGACKP